MVTILLAILGLILAFANLNAALGLLSAMLILTAGGFIAGAFYSFFRL